MRITPSVVRWGSGTRERTIVVEPTTPELAESLNQLAIDTLPTGLTATWELADTTPAQRRLRVSAEGESLQLASPAEIRLTLPGHDQPIIVPILFGGS